MSRRRYSNPMIAGRSPFYRRLEQAGTKITTASTVRECRRLGHDWKEEDAHTDRCQRCGETR